jgi:predicted GNAT superfamily acetyltransferase
MEKIHIEPLRSLDEMAAAVEVQKVHWGDDMEALVPAHVLFSLANYGGHVLAAKDVDRVVGVLIGFLGTDIEESDRPAMANLLIMSKRMVVLPEYRGRGIGYQLKLAQRNLAIQQGVRLITWTFDPVEAVNAHLNIRKLGVVSQKYIVDHYGTEGYFTTLGTSDRLVADWWVTKRRVKERINGSRRDLILRQYLDADTVIVNPTGVDAAGNLTPSENTNPPVGSLTLLEIPTDFGSLLKSDQVLARDWRAHVRDLITGLFASGYTVTDFIFGDYMDRYRAFYVLSRNLGYDYRWN